MPWPAGARCGQRAVVQMPEPDLLRALRAMAPPAAGCGWADPRHDHGLLGGESLPGAVPRRLREFSAGRAAARAALAQIGLAPVAIPHGADRAPVWPRGVIGSISHSATQCLAVALPLGVVRGIGIDLEEDTPLAPDLWPLVLDAVERSTQVQAQQAKQVFSAKEAAYKAQYPLTKTMLDFHDLRITLGDGTFQAQLQRAVAPLTAGDRLHGRISRSQGHILTLALL